MSTDVTIKQIAKHSGFSISTVSKALNNSFEISVTTKSKIHKIAKSLNYTPNVKAKSLRNKKTNIIAVIVPQIDSLKYASIISQIQEKAFKKKYKTLVLETLFCESKEQKCIDSISDGYVEGAILIHNNYCKYTKLKSTHQIPIVTIDVNEEDNTNHDGIFAVKKLFKSLA